MILRALTLAITLLATSAPLTAAWAQTAGKAVPEAVALTYVARTDNNALYVTNIPAGPVKRVTRWTFYKDPQTAGFGRYNTLSTLIELDCTAGTAQTLGGAVLFGETFGEDQATRIVTTTSTVQPKAQPTPGTVNEALLRYVCDGKTDPRINQRFNSLSEARAYTLVVLTQ